MRRRTLLILLLPLFALLGTHAQAQAQVSVTGMLVKGMSTPGNNANIPAATLKTLDAFKGRFKSYKLVGRGETKIGVGKSGSLNLGNGHMLSTNVKTSAGGKVETALKWTKGGKKYFAADAKLPIGGLPMVFGGPREGDGNLILLVQAK